MFNFLVLNTIDVMFQWFCSFCQ